MEKYTAELNTQKIDEHVIIDNIIVELDNTRNVAIDKKKRDILKMKLGSVVKKKILLIILFF